MIAVVVRGLFVACALGLGCTTDNPAFDLERPTDAGDEGGKDGGSSTAPSSTTIDATTGRGTSGGVDTSDGSAGTSGGHDDVMSADVPPDPMCPFALGAGLDLVFGDPADFGNSCPSGVSIWSRIDFTGPTPIATSCDPGCDNCTGAYPVSAEPLALAEHVPADAAVCLGIEATAPLGDDGENCYWGALTIWNASSLAPYVVATSRGTGPTDTGARLLAGVIQPPEEAGTCGCETLDFADLCCAEAEMPPTFFYVPHEGAGVYTGDTVPVTIPNGATLPYLFHLYQAQAIPSCNDVGPQISWAVYAEL